MAELKAKHAHRQNEDHHVKKHAMQELTAKHGHRTNDCHPHKSEAMKELTRKNGHKQKHCHPHKSVVMKELVMMHSPEKQVEKRAIPRSPLGPAERKKQEATLAQGANYVKSAAHLELLEKHGHKQRHADNQHKACFPVKKEMLDELKFMHGHKAVDSHEHPPLRDEVMLAVEELKISVSHIHHTKPDFDKKSAVMGQLTAMHGHKTKEDSPVKKELHAQLQGVHAKKIEAAAKEADVTAATKTLVEAEKCLAKAKEDGAVDIIIKSQKNLAAAMHIAADKKAKVDEALQEAKEAAKEPKIAELHTAMNALAEAEKSLAKATKEGNAAAIIKAEKVVATANEIAAKKKAMVDEVRAPTVMEG